MSDQYEKASRYNLPAQLRNYRVFLDEIRRKPWKAFAICICFAACALALFIIQPQASAKFSSPWQLWIVGALAALISVYFAWQGVVGLLDKK